MITNRLLILLFFTASKFAFSHSDVIMFYQAKNVKSAIKTGSKTYVETEKCRILTELSQQLCEKYAYTDSIYIDIKHNYVDEVTKSVYIVDNQLEFQFIGDEYFQSKTSKKGFCIRIFDMNLSISAVLELMEQAIVDKSFVSKNRFHFKPKNKRISIFIFDEEEYIFPNNLYETSQLKSSQIVAELLQQKFIIDVNKDETEKHTEFFWQHNSFFATIQKGALEENTIEITNVKYVKVLDKLNTFLIFDTRNSFSIFNPKNPSLRYVTVESKAISPYFVRYICENCNKVVFYVYINKIWILNVDSGEILY